MWPKMIDFFFLLPASYFLLHPLKSLFSYAFKDYHISYKSSKLRITKSVLVSITEKKNQ